MKPRAILCIDSISAQHPESLGLEGENLDSQEWLEVICDAAYARTAIPYMKAAYVWVAGSDQIDAINLAAALIHDGCPRVALVTSRKSGSLYSRAGAAGIRCILDRYAFIKAYSQVKRFALSDGDQPKQNACIRDRSNEPLRNASSHSAVVGPQSVRATVLQPQEAVTQRATAIPISVEESSEKEPHVSAYPPQRQAITRRDMHAGGMVLSVVGAAGGVGKSTISVATALSLARAGKSTIIIDADLQCGDIHYLMGQDKAMRIDDILAVSARLEALAPERDKPVVLASPRALEHSEAASAALPQIISALRQRFECVVVNTGPTWDDLHMELIALSNSVLFVLDQRPTAIKLCRHVLDLCSRCGIATQSFVFMLNRCGRGSLFSSIDVSCALSGAKAVEVQDGGKAVEEMLGCGHPNELFSSRNGFISSVQKAVLPLVGATQQTVDAQPQAKRSWFRLASRRQEAACL